MNKTKVFYPTLVAFFIGGALIGTIGANLVSKDAIQSLGIYQMYTGTYLDSFSITEKNWIFYIILKRMEFWILYVLLAFTAARWVVVSFGSATFGCIGAVLLVAMTRIWGGFSILLFCATLIPHYIAYIGAFIFSTEAVRITMIAHPRIVMQKVVAGSLCWCIGVVSEIFMNPTIVYWAVRVLRK